jgi:hypothetical protein
MWPDGWSSWVLPFFGPLGVVDRLAWQEERAEPWAEPGGPRRPRPRYQHYIYAETHFPPVADGAVTI